MHKFLTQATDRQMGTFRLRPLYPQGNSSSHPLRMILR